MSDDILINEPATVYACLVASAARWPQQPFLVVPQKTADTYGIAAGDTTYAQALLQVEKLRAGYGEAGVCAGMRAGLMLGNQPAFYWHWLAFNALGVSVVPINAEFRAAELAYLIGDSGLSIVVAPPADHKRLGAAAEANGEVLSFVDPSAEDPVAGLRMEPVRREADNALSGDAGSSNVPVCTAVFPGLNSECALLYTSGTTGQPKGCILPNEYFIFAGACYRDLGGVCAIEFGKDRLISPLPLVHMNAMACSSMVMMMTGGAIILLDRFHPGSWWQTVRSTRASIVHYLGVMPAMLMSAADDPGVDLEHAVRFGFGAGVDRRHHAAFEARFGFPLLEAWAMTETGMAGCIIANHEPRKVGTQCFGRPPAGLAWRILDEAGNPCGIDQPGELLVRRADALPDFGFFKGYLNKQEATAQAWAGGWFHTGDVVSCDAQGDFHFVDRRKNVIRRSGENISAVEVEGVLLQHDAVVAVGVAPVPDSVRGDEVMACVVLGDGRAPDRATGESLVAHCLARLAYFKAPGYICFVPALPVTPTQKIQRAELRSLALDAQRGQRQLEAFDLREVKKRKVDHSDA